MLGTHRPDFEELAEDGKFFDLDTSGYCTACGTEEIYGVEPDAENYKCEVCGKRAVYGYEQLLLLTVA